MQTAAEDCGLLAVDCVVVCCCCPCLLLRVTLFLFIRLPVKSTRIVLRRIKKRLKKNGRSRQEMDGKAAAVDGAPGHLCDLCEGSSFADEAEKVLQGLLVDDEGRVWVESEKVWEELIGDEGLFWFGSFWGCDASRA
ncbi:uncharacterized protein LOC122037992 [Zingiber officinale]|uniref:Uncharacterized protein n=1 Tax=Zingiber officinale TaxID=94328 RepID=A0A8J5I0G5_ZINOF|nr:uncharacterized protein LOC122037992 [Zingiber officinale]KAG6537987.1 hypothetical protein ZIOFF_003090 [Zingiber officinale]